MRKGCRKMRASSKGRGRMQRPFDTELKFFIANQAELVKKYRNRFLVLKGETILGVYDSAIEALTESKKHYRLGTFMIQPCIPGPEAYTITITSTSISVS
jgi:hypothetical protein